jgi:protein TonB
VLKDHIGLISSLAFHALAVVGTGFWAIKSLPRAVKNAAIAEDPIEMRVAAPKIKIRPALPPTPPEPTPEPTAEPPPVAVAILPPPPPKAALESPTAPPAVVAKKAAPVTTLSAKPKADTKSKADTKPKAVTKPSFTSAEKPLKPASAAAPVAAIPATPVQYIRRATLSYPAAAKRQKQQGVVKIRVRIDASGDLLTAEITTSSGFPLLDEAALRCARTSRYRAATRNGKPVAAWSDASFRFDLD